MKSIFINFKICLKKFFFYFLFKVKFIIPTRLYTYILFLTCAKRFKFEINKPKRNDKFSKNLDKINNFEYRITSQNNEDGIINHIFSKINNSKFFVELGFDFWQCNTLNLIKNGWSGILVDSDETKCLKMKKCLDYFFPNNNVKVINTKINKHNINDIIKLNSHEKDIDFFSIDIDGNDYWVLEKMETKNIKVICLEYNPMFNNDVPVVIKYNKNFTFKNNFYFGASLTAYTNLAKKTNFDLIAVDSSGTNAFFINEKFNDSFEVLSPIKSYRPLSRYYSAEEILKIKKNLLNKDYTYL